MLWKGGSIMMAEISDNGETISVKLIVIDSNMDLGWWEETDEWEGIWGREDLRKLKGVMHWKSKKLKWKEMDGRFKVAWINFAVRWHAFMSHLYKYTCIYIYIAKLRNWKVGGSKFYLFSKVHLNITRALEILSFGNLSYPHTMFINAQTHYTWVKNPNNLQVIVTTKPNDTWQ